MPADPGLQNERTTLAWQRTTLAGLACALIIARLIFANAPGIAVLIAAVAIIVAAGIGLLSRTRYKINNDTWSSAQLGTDGRTAVALASLIVIIGLSAAGYILLG